MSYATTWAVRNDPAYDLTIKRDQATTFVNGYGWDAFLELLGTLAKINGQPDGDLYAVSTDWLRRRYITTLKARGARGDLLVKLV